MMKKFQKIINSNHSEKTILFDVRFMEDGVRKPVIIFAHGFKGFKDWGHFNLVADYFAKQGFVYLKLNFSHNGTTAEQPIDFTDLEAFGNNNFTKELDDLGNVIDYIFMNENGIPPNEINSEKVFLIGHSRGGGSVIIKGSENKRVTGLATWAAVESLAFSVEEEVLERWKEEGVQYVYNGRTKQNMPLYYQLAEDFIKNASRLNIETAMKNMHKPMIAFHGTNDEAVPLSAAENLKEWNPSLVLEIMKATNHTFGGKHPYDEVQLPVDTQYIIDKTIHFFKDIVGA